MPPVDFDLIPSTLEVPGVFLEVDASKAVQRPERKKFVVLIIGQMLSSGTVAALEPRRVRSVDEAKLWWGRASQIATSFQGYFDNNDFTEVWGIGVADPAGQAATRTITLTGTATLAGTVNFLINGRLFQLPWAASANTTTLATALAALVQADLDCEMTATSNANVVTLTARHVGVMGNDIDVRHSHYPGEVLPPGASVAIAVGQAGTGDAVLSAVWTPLGDKAFDCILQPFTDATNMTSFETELVRRANPLVNIRATGFTCKAGSFSTVSTLVNARNSSAGSMVIDHNASPSAPWAVAAMWLGQCALSASNDSARPFRTLPLIGMIAPKVTDRRTLADWQSLISSGCAVYEVDAGGTCRILKAVTTYKTNANGAIDRSLRSLNTHFNIAFVSWDLPNALKQAYPRHKKGKDGGNYGGGQLVVTPSTLKSFIALRGGYYHTDLTLIEDPEQFTRDIVVEDNANPDRYDVQISPNFVNGLDIIAIKNSFIL